MNPSCESTDSIPSGDAPFCALADRLLGPATDIVGNRGRIEPENEASPWIYVRFEQEPPAQGWKLHVSATPDNAREVLEHVLPVLRDGHANFKFAKSVEILADINTGMSGQTQVGKFITVYPRDEAHAVALAGRLDEVTRGLSGPMVPTDRRLTPTSLVHYRYGSFRERYSQNAMGEIFAAIDDATGVPQPEIRAPFYHAPAGRPDPFVAAGYTQGVALEPASMTLVADRFVVVRHIYLSPHGAIWIAMDTVTNRRCVLKQARGDLGDRSSELALMRLRQEAAILERLGDCRHVPEFIAFVEHGTDWYLAMEDIGGLTLQKVVSNAFLHGDGLPVAKLLALGIELTDILGSLHERGLIYRDTKSTNFLVSKDGRLRLIDVETMHDPTGAVPALMVGTRGYVSPEHARREAPTLAGDIYGLGALLFFMATGSEPPQAADPANLLARPVQRLNPAIGREIAAIIERCLAPTPADRYSSMNEVRSALRMASEVEAPFVEFGTAIEPGNNTTDFRELAARLGKTLCADAREAPDGISLYWASARAQLPPLMARDLATGGAGAVFALGALAEQFQTEMLCDHLRRGARWLAVAPRPPWTPLPGFFMGEAGIGAAILRAALVLMDDELLQAVARRATLIASLPYVSPDLFNGTAGRIRFHLWLHAATGDQLHLDNAIAAGQTFVMRQPIEDGICWRIPPGYGGLSGQRSLGYSHGAAGIADVLLDLHEVTGDARWRDAAAGAGRWLVARATPAGGALCGLGWPMEEGGSPAPAFWCHGAAGIGRFFLHARQLNLLPEAAAMAAGAARSTARLARWASPVPCHGLCGNIELLLDMYQDGGEKAYLVEALSLADLLMGWAIEQDGKLAWAGEIPDRCTPDLMTGYSGVALCLLRLNDPLNAPHLLSHRGFLPRSAVATAS